MRLALVPLLGLAALAAVVALAGGRPAPTRHPSASVERTDVVTVGDLAAQVHARAVLEVRR